MHQVKRLREQLGINQVDFAAEMGMSKHTYRYAESKNHNPEIRQKAMYILISKIEEKISRLQADLEIQNELLIEYNEKFYNPETNQVFFEW